MSYFVTGATGFIGRHLVERLLEREGDIHVLVREESQEKLEALRERWGAGDRVKPVIGDLAEPLLGVSEEDRAALQGRRALLPPRGDLRHDRRRGAQPPAQRQRHPARRRPRQRARRGPLPPRLLDRGRGRVRGHFTEDSFDEGQKLTHPYHRTKYEAEKLVRQGVGAVARVPALGRRRQLQDRRDGQDRRALLLLQGDPEGPPHAAGVVPARRHRGRQDEHRPVDYVAAAMDHIAHLPGLDGQAFHLVDPKMRSARRGHQHLRPGRPRAADGHARRQEDDRHAAEGRAVLRHEAAGAQGHPRARCSPTSASRTRSSSTSALKPTLRRARHQARAATARASSCRRSRTTPTSCGTTGSATSTPTSSRTAPSRARSTARP